MYGFCISFKHIKWYVSVYTYIGFVYTAIGYRCLYLFFILSETSPPSRFKTIRWVKCLVPRIFQLHLKITQTFRNNL